MKKILLLALLVFLVSCSVKYTEFKQDSFSASYPAWETSSSPGNNMVSVQKGPCKVDIALQDNKFDPSNLQAAIDVSIIPALKNVGLHIDDRSISSNEAVLTLSAENVYGKQKYVPCDNKLYKVSAACNKNNPIIDEVIRSAKCSS